MGQQSNKIEKRRRRANYLERQKQKAKDAAVAAAKPRVRKPAARKAAPAPKPAAPVEAVAEAAPAAE